MNLEPNIPSSADLLSVNQAVSEAGDVPQLTEKQRIKKEQQAKKYWKSMITRQEAYEMVEAATEESNRRMQLLFIQVKTLTQALIDKGLYTLEELDELSKPIVNELLGDPTITQGEDSNEEDNSN